MKRKDRAQNYSRSVAGGAGFWFGRFVLAAILIGVFVTGASAFPSDDEWGSDWEDKDSASSPEGSDAARPDASGADEEAMIPAVMGLPPEPEVVAYRLRRRDRVNISVFGMPELSTSQHLDNSGNISLPLIGRVAVGGLTIEEAELLIADRLGRDYFQNPTVTMFVEDYTPQRITIMGAVGNQSVFNITEPTTLLQVLAMAKGFTNTAEQSRVILFRTEKPGQSVAYVIDGRKIQYGELPDPILMENDKIYVPGSNFRYLFREVTSIIGTIRGYIPLL